MTSPIDATGSPSGSPTSRWLVGIVVSATIGALLAWAGSQGSTSVGSVPVFALAVGFAYVLNWLVFVPSFAAHTEKYFDLTGSLTYLSVTIGSLSLAEDLDARAWLVGLLVIIWAGRLGSFLFRRVNNDGGDGRFDSMKYDLWQFLMTWTIQGLWVSLTAAAALIVITAEEREPFGVLGVVGAVVWLAGFAIEVTADRQKSRFKADPANKGRFIDVGLWAWSRHPNYFGEIVLWTGVAIISLPVLYGWRWIALVSPVFVYVLLTRVSGIPIQARRAKKRWGDDPEFQRYFETTPALVPRPPKD